MRAEGTLRGLAGASSEYIMQVDLCSCRAQLLTRVARAFALRDGRTAAPPLVDVAALLREQRLVVSHKVL